MKYFSTMFNRVTVAQTYWAVIFLISVNVVFTNYFYFLSNELLYLSRNSYVSYTLFTVITFVMTLIIRFNKWEKTNTSWGSFSYPALNDLEKMVVVLMFVVSVFFCMKPDIDYFISQVLFMDNN